MSAGSRLLLVGLGGSGKTTYLAALWHLMEAGDIPASLKTSRLQPDREYLNRIRDSWLSFKEVGRTPLRAEHEVSLLLEDARTGAPVSLTVPDLSGESFRLQWTMRKATRRYADYAKECAGVLLFVHPLAVRRAARIVPGTPAATPPEPAQPWSPEHTPTSVLLVELLQFVRLLRDSSDSLRVAVIVSAWDRIRDSMLPSAWVERRLPLLSQFLTANANAMPFRIYGVSALGGDLEQDIARLKEEAIPARRIQVLQETLRPDHDLSAPLRFLLSPNSEPKDRR